MHLNQLKPPKESPYSVRISSRIQEASDHMRLLQGWGLKYEQLSRGRFEGSLREAWLDGIHVYQESLSQVVFQSGMAREKSVCLGVFSSLSGEAKWFGNSLSTDDVMFLNGGDELLLTTPKESTLLVLCIPESLLESFDSPPSSQHFIRDAALANALRKGILDALNYLLTKPLHFSNKNSRNQFNFDIQTLVSDCISRSLDNSPEIERGRARSVVNSAIHYVVENKGEIISIDDICQKTFTSRRTLQNCFEKITGESPAFFLKAQRLNAVRRELLSSKEENKIGDVAANWGFWHFSQFSTDYKRLFGELPSDTAHFAHSRTRY
jgi:AraC family transcriptional regulator, ethanolamine operon transcriptional activator